MAKTAVTTAQAEQGEARSLWDIIQGITAHARSIPNTDDRVKLGGPGRTTHALRGRQLDSF